MNPKLKTLLGSRKFWTALVGVALITVKAFRSDFALTDEQVTNVVYVLVAYIVGTGIEDTKKS